MFSCMCINRDLQNSSNRASFVNNGHNKILLQNINKNSYKIQPFKKEENFEEISFQKVTLILPKFDSVSYAWISNEAYSVTSENGKKNIIVTYLKNTIQSNYTIIYAHGCGVTLGEVYPFLVDLASMLKCNVISFDYSGFGISTGTASVQGAISDTDLAALFARNVLNIPKEETILMGYSFGTYPVIVLSTRDFYKEYAGVILISPIASPQFIDSRGTETPKSKAPNPVDEIENIKPPVFIGHGERDEIAPLRTSENMIKRLNFVFKWFPKNGTHFNIFTKFRAKFYKKIRFFLDSIQRLAEQEKISMSKVSSLAIITNPKKQREENSIYSNEDLTFIEQHKQYRKSNVSQDRSTLNLRKEDTLLPYVGSQNTSSVNKSSNLVEQQ